MSEQMRMEFNDPFKGREATVSKCQASRGLGGLSEMLSPMGDESKTTRFSGGLLFHLLKFVIIQQNIAFFVIIFYKIHSNCRIILNKKR